LKVLPHPIIDLDYSLYGVNVNNVNHFFTAYFPVSRCTDLSQEKISQRANEFIEEALLLNGPGHFRSIAPGWIKESQIIDGVHVKGFMLNIIWSDRQSEMHFKAQSTLWTSLIQDFWAGGSLREEEYHGHLLQVKPWTELVSIPPGDSKTEENTETEASNSHDQHAVSTSIAFDNRSTFDRARGTFPMDPKSPLSDDQMAMNRARIESIYKRLAEDLKSRDKYQEDDSDLESEDESLSTSPIMTPSSSTSSLLTLSEKSQVRRATAGDRNSRKTYQFEPDYDSSSPDSDSNIEPDLASLRNRLEASAPPSKEKLDRMNANCTWQYPAYGAKSAEVRAKRRNGIVEWNAEEEIREAQSRFRRYRRRVHGLRSGLQRDERSVETTDASLEAGLDEIEHSPLEEKSPWWKSITGFLSKGNPADYDLEEEVPETLRMRIPGSFGDLANNGDTLRQGRVPVC
jgi:hypothetical protein